MNPVMIITSLRQRRVAILAYCIGGFALVWLYTAIFPSLQSQAQSYNAILKSINPAILKALGVSTTGINNLEGLLATEEFGLTWPLLLIFMMLSLAGTALAGEIEQTTLGLWLSAPVSRMKIYWSKFSAGLISLAAFMTTSVLAVIPLAKLYHTPVSSQHIIALSIVGGLFGLAVFGLAMAISSLVSSKGRVYAVLSALIIVMFVANLVAGLTERFSDLKYISFFYYYNANSLISGAPINRWSLVVFGLVALIGSIAGAVIFSRRNLPI